MRQYGSSICYGVSAERPHNRCICISGQTLEGTYEIKRVALTKRSTYLDSRYCVSGLVQYENLLPSSGFYVRRCISIDGLMKEVAAKDE